MPTRNDLIAVGLTARQVNYWTNKGYLRLAQPCNGSGHALDFEPGEVAVAALMAVYVMAGLTPAAAERAARHNGMIAPGVRVILSP